MQIHRFIPILCAVLLLIGASPAIAWLDPFDDIDALRSFISQHDYGETKDPPYPTMEDLYGPTNMNGCTGNGAMAVGISTEGDLTVLRWPTPSTWDQVDYLAINFYEPRMGARFDAGVFSGLIIDGALSWLREAPWARTQSYLSDEDSILVTTYVNDEFDISVRQMDFVLHDRDVLARRYVVDPGPDFSASDIKLVCYENLDPCNSHIPLVPIRDWLLDGLNDGAAQYDSVSEILHHYRHGFGSLHPAIHFAIGADKPVTTWQVGHEGSQDGANINAFVDLDDGILSGNPSTDGPVNAALVIPIDMKRKEVNVTVYFAAAHSYADATELLNDTRSESSQALMNQTQEWWRRWIARATLPDTDDEQIIRTSKRLLISIRVGTDKNSGMMVASISSQPPYYVDWPRDGAFMNHALDMAGYHEMVTAHNYYYAGIQRPLTGSYWMNYTPDGLPGGPLPLEIDADGVIAWALWEHASFLSEPERSEYLDSIWPTIKKGAEFLCLWREPDTGLPLPSFELDSLTPVQTLAGASAAFAGIKAAITAGDAVGENENVMNRLRECKEDLEQAMLREYYNEQQQVFTAHGYGGAYLVWPTEFFPADHPATRDMAQIQLEAQAPAIDMTAEWGSYNGVAMMAIIHALKDDPNYRERLEYAMKIFMDVLPTPDTRHWGEGWYLIEGEGGPEFENHVAMPHLLTGAYNFIATMKLYGPRAPDSDDDINDDMDDDSDGDDLSNDQSDETSEDSSDESRLCGC